MYWGKYVQHDNNRDGMGQFLKLTQAVTKRNARVAPDGHPRSARSADLSLLVHRHRSVQQRHRSDRRLRVVDARRERRDGDDQARRARRLDLRVLRRLGAELHVLHRAQPQLDRPLLRGPELRSRSLHGHAGRDDDEQGVVPAEPAAADDQVGPAQQHQHPGVGAAVLAQPRREEQGSVSRELLAEEQARGRQGQDRADLRVGDSGDAAPQGRRRAGGQRAADAGARSVESAVVASRPAAVDVKAGDYIVRGDQPFRTLADMYFSIQNYAPQNPSPYDDTGWTFQYMRDLQDPAGRPRKASSISR